MKKIVLFVFIVMTFSISSASIDTQRIDNLQREVSNLRASVSRLQQENVKMYDLYQQQGARIDSLYRLQTNDLNTKTNKLDGDLKNANKKIDDSTSLLSDSINSRTWMSLCGILTVLALLGIAYYILRKKIRRGSSSLDKIKTAQEKLEEAQKAMQEEAVTLDNKLVELLEKQLKQNPEPVQDHSFVLSIANEIARIEQNLAFMDNKVKGVSNLKNRASAINASLKSKGYEIPKLVGEKYKDEYNMIPTMELDEDLPAGTQIIRRVIKPMVLYNGKMIQAAQVVVAFNE